MNTTTETRPQRIARQRRQAADRSRRHRQKAKDAQKPNSRQIDAAITEALSFLFLVEGRINRDTLLRFGDLYGVARLVLIRGGFDRGGIDRALRARLNPHPEHMEIGNVPSVRLVTSRLPERGWTRAEVELMHAMAKRRYKAGSAMPRIPAVWTVSAEPTMNASDLLSDLLPGRGGVHHFPNAVGLVT